MDSQFKALMAREKDGIFSTSVELVSIEDLPQNEVLIEVSYSSVNYKDALSASGNKGVTKKFPHIPGIDAVGKVVNSKSEKFNIGDEVLVTGYDLGMNTWGGFGKYICVPASWLLKLPEKLSAFEAMSFGTAGLTAGLSVYNLIQNGITQNSGKVAVSGATGGVGSLSVAILAKLNYETVAISGKSDDEFLRQKLGASDAVSREEFIAKYDAKTMSSTGFSGGIDTVGGAVLSGILKSVKYGGTVTCCGNVASAQISTSIFPFILRGIKLIGIDSVEQPIDFKEKIWNLLADKWKPDNLKELVQEISLEQLPEILQLISQGKSKGRFVVNHSL